MNAKTLAFLRTLTDEYLENELTPAIGKTMTRYLWMYEENRIQDQEKIQTLEDIINQLKGEKGKVNIPANKNKPKDISSEKERNPDPPKQSKGRGARNHKIPITREEKCYYPRDQLPPDAIFKGYQPVIVQNIKITQDNVKFLLEIYYSPSTKKTYRAHRPAGYEGEYGPGVRTFILSQKHIGNMSESCIQSLLSSYGVHISQSSISRISRKDIALFHEDAAEILKAGIISADYINIDDTGARVNGNQQYTQILCNPFFTAYATIEHKNRLSILKTLLMGAELQFQFDDATFELLELFKVPEKVREYLKINCNGKTLNLEDLDCYLKAIPSKNRNPDQLHRRIMEAAGIVWYNTQDKIPIVPGFISDDAPQFRHITGWHALCWVHAGRLIKKLNPSTPIFQVEVGRVLTEFWDYYHTLSEFQKSPDTFNIDELRDRFNRIFNRTTGYLDLDKILQSIMSNKEKLLMVLKLPEIPLHNNAAELGARTVVRKRDVSLHTQTPEGTKAVDTGMTIIQTAKKLGVNALLYLNDRISLNVMERLAVTLLKKAGLPV